MLQKVALVKAGEWGSKRQDKGDYDELVERLTNIVEEARQEAGPDRCKIKAAKSYVAGSTQEALSWLGGHGVIVFVSRVMATEAKEVASKHPGIRVILFTGLIPEGEVVFISHGWLLQRKEMERILLDS